MSRPEIEGIILALMNAHKKAYQPVVMRGDLTWLHYFDNDEAHQIFMRWKTDPDKTKITLYFSFEPFTWEWPVTARTLPGFAYANRKRPLKGVISIECDYTLIGFAMAAYTGGFFTVVDTAAMMLLSRRRVKRMRLIGDGDWFDILRGDDDD